MKALIEPAELQDLLDAGQVKMVDATFGVPNPLAGMEMARIGDAVYFDIDAVADKRAHYPHTLPSAEDFALAVGRMGISNKDTVVVYDQNGLSFAAARVWWMFRVFGHENVRVLNGGLGTWLSEGLPVDSGEMEMPEAVKYTAHFRPDLYRSFEDMEEARDLVIDARPQARFSATVHGPDGDPTPAHIEGSRNVPFTNLLEPGGQRMRSKNSLSEILKPLATGSKKITVSCGSGVTACVLALGFHEAGFPNVAVYDGSWVEWADRNGLRG